MRFLKISYLFYIKEVGTLHKYCYNTLVFLSNVLTENGEKHGG